MMCVFNAWVFLNIVERAELASKAESKILQRVYRYLTVKEEVALGEELTLSLDLFVLLGKLKHLGSILELFTNSNLLDTLSILKIKLFLCSCLHALNLLCVKINSFVSDVGTDANDIGRRILHFELAIQLKVDKTEEMQIEFLEGADNLVV